jgi:hypothetical protein
MKPSLTYLKILPSEELTYKILHRLNQMQVTQVLSLLILVEAFSVNTTTDGEHKRKITRVLVIITVKSLTLVVRRPEYIYINETIVTLQASFVGLSWTQLSILKTTIAIFYMINCQ